MATGEDFKPRLKDSPTGPEPSLVPMPAVASRGLASRYVDDGVNGAVCDAPSVRATIEDEGPLRVDLLHLDVVWGRAKIMLHGREVGHWPSACPSLHLAAPPAAQLLPQDPFAGPEKLRSSW